MSIHDRTLSRPSGGDGDSCDVSRLSVAYVNDRNRRAQAAYVLKRVRGPSYRYEDDAYKTVIKGAGYKIEGRLLSALNGNERELPRFAKALKWEDVREFESCLVLEDLSNEFEIHGADLGREKNVRAAAEWCAAFHFEAKDLRIECDVWRCGG